jgi:N-acetylmuramoyl-L-alanine amidase
MIGALILALQALAVPNAITVKGARSEAVVPVIESSIGPAIAVGQLAPALPLSLRTTPSGEHVLEIGDVRLELTVGLPFAASARGVVPLGGAPFLNESRLYVPLQVVTEILPRLAPTLLAYEPSRGELRLTADASSRLASRSSTVEAPTARPASARTSTTRTASRGARRRRVVVDAGHGGRDPGAGTARLGGRRSVHEKDITLAVALKLRQALRAKGVDVVMTRTSDTLIDLSDRGRIANESHADLFISIHVNAPSPRWRNRASVRGFETYFLAEAITEDDRRVEAMENSSIRFETSAEASRSDPLSYIINDMAQNEHLRESGLLAELVQQELGRVHSGPDRGVRQANFAVLRTSFMPAVLVEIGFGSNADEARFLTTSARQTQIAGAIANAATAYLEQYERRLGTASQ